MTRGKPGAWLPLPLLLPLLHIYDDGNEGDRNVLFHVGMNEGKRPFVFRGDENPPFRWHEMQLDTDRVPQDDSINYPAELDF